MKDVEWRPTARMVFLHIFKGVLLLTAPDGLKALQADGMVQAVWI